MITKEVVNLPELENLANLVTYSPDKFTSKILLENGTHNTILFAFSKEQELKTHTTPNPALLIMLEGICAFRMNNKTQTLSAGQVISIPAQAPHSLTATTDFKMVLVK